jgi:hypothetical protein
MNSPVAFLENERSLAERLGIELPPLRKFSLESFGINSGRFLADFNPSFDALDWDYYDVKAAQVKLLEEFFPEEHPRLRQFLPGYYTGRQELAEVAPLLRRLPPEGRRALESIQPYRQRSIAGLTVSGPAAGSLRVERFPMRSFAQNVGADDYRSQNRVFPETAEEVTAHADFRQLVVALAEAVREVEQAPRTVKMVFHQVRTTVKRGRPSAVVPEGIHQDGARYVVTALVTEREAVTGGESIVYGPDKKTPYLRTVLAPGEGLFHADSNSPLWHDVTPIRVDPSADRPEGRRSIIGFDINVES